MSDYQFSIVEHVVTDESIDKVSHVLFEFRRFTFELLERLGKTMCDLNIPSTKFAHQFRIVISRHRERVARFVHTNH